MDEKNITLAEKLLNVQTELKAPKSQYNSFGKYTYRSAEDIVEAVKPLAKTHRILLTISDEVIETAGRIYIKATAAVFDVDSPERMISCTAYAREPESKKGMDDSQITGTASSYARKYALNGLFAIDDTKDADTDEYKGADASKNKAEGANKDKTEEPKIKCAKCGKLIEPTKGKDGMTRSPSEVAEACGGICPQCYKAAKKAAEAQTASPPAAGNGDYPPEL